MHVLRYFNFVFYLMLLLGLAGFAVAAISPGIFIFSVAVVIARIALGGSRPIRVAPVLISWLSIFAVALCAVAVLRGYATAVTGFSYLLVCLILAKLFDQRGNRDYAQVMVMSLLLMTAAAVNSASLLYGVIFILHLLVGLYLSLLLHLKAETENADKWMRLLRPAASRPAENASLPRSLRRLSAAIIVFALACGIAAFLFIPRTRLPAAAVSTGQTSGTMTGFSERVSFEQVARITQNHEVVAHVSLRKNGQVYAPADFYLRGTTLNLYTGATPVDREGGRWQWFRRPLWSTLDRTLSLGPGEAVALAEPVPPDAVEMEIDLQPTGSRVLFFLPGLKRVWSQRGLTLEWHPPDGSVKVAEVLRSVLRYGGVCSEDLGPEVIAEPRMDDGDSPRRYHLFRRWLPSTSRIDPRVEEYARRPDVSGRAPDGTPLTELRGNVPGASDLDEAIARSIETHLRSSFSYTLDLTDHRRDEDTDPLVAFLYDYRQGHCEYFAGAMTLMCQSLGLQARMAIGFRVGGDSYNSIGDYYLVRQSNAHAWVEVLTPRGWIQFDPTSGSAGGLFRRSQPTMWTRAKDVWDYLNYRWAVGVVTYGEEDRATILERVSATAQESSEWFGDLAGQINRWLREEAAYTFSSTVLGLAIGFFVLLAMVAVVAFVYERSRLRKRALRLGLDSDSVTEQLRLARQLAFYDTLLRMLERRGMQRAGHQTPREFASSLTHLPGDAYRGVRGVTEVFYRVRFGGRSLTGSRQRWLMGALRRISRSLDELPLQSPPT